MATNSGWGLKYFAQYFDVTTDDVIQRILWSAIPLNKTENNLEDSNDSELTLPLTIDKTSVGFRDGDTISVNDQNDEHQGSNQLSTKLKQLNYMERFIQSRPDFYGPFWISTTLIFAVAIFSNIVRFIEYKAKETESMNPNPITATKTNDQLGLEFHYSMDELNTAATVVLFQVTLLPASVWFLFWFRGCAKYYTIAETICAYGYSLAIFVPLSALLVIQAVFFRYFVLTVASLLSSMVLVISFLPVARSDPQPAGSHIILVIVAVFQLGLAYIIHRLQLV